MNFLEFVSDDYVFFRAEHFFKGFFLNRVPLLKKLGLREIVTFKAVYGTLNDSNNPALTEGIPNFTFNAEDVPLTYTFTEGRPYFEASIGFSNIFKFLRVDLIRRLNYLEHPNVPELFDVEGLGIRARLKVEF